MILMRRRSAWALVAIGLIALLGPSRRVLAWGNHAHRIATRIAEGRLTPAARAAVRELLLEGDTLVTVANWADHEGHDVEPDSAPWHYVNVPIDTPKYDARFCRGGNCVVAKIKHYRALLADRKAPRRERARALLFYIHLVEDVHQPLHVGDNHDRGGNLTQVTFLNEATNLHRMWDSQILDDAGRDERVWVQRITPMITREKVEAWSKGDVESWADESLQAAKEAYHHPKGSARPIASGTRLGRDYAERSLIVIEERLAQAGVRLANELNTIFEEAPAKAKGRETSSAPRR
jgi:hypothetical protein